MCVDCWNAGMAAPAAIVAGRFAWVGYRDKIPFLRRRTDELVRPAEIEADEVDVDEIDVHELEADEVEGPGPPPVQVPVGVGPPPVAR